MTPLKRTLTTKIRPKDATVSGHSGASVTNEQAADRSAASRRNLMQSR